MSYFYRNKFRIGFGELSRVADCGLRIVNPRRRAFSRADAADKSTAWITNPQSEFRNPKSRGLSLIEVVASTFIVGLMAVAALNALGAATRSSESIGNRAVALGLADELMAEILQSPYKDPEQTPVLGRESGEPAGPRSAFNDIDDYDGWNQSPPQYSDGTAIPDRAEWRQRVEVGYVAPGDPTQVVASDQGAKRIRVVIEYRNQVLAEQVAVRTDTD